MLTARQMVIIATRSSAPPLHLSGLAKMYTVSPFSLRAIANLLHQQKTYVLCYVRNLSLLSTVSSYAELQTAFFAPGQQPSQATLQNLANIVNAAGGSLHNLSQGWGMVCIAGTLEPLAGLTALDIKAAAASAPPSASSVRPLDDSDPPSAWHDIFEGVSVLGGALITIALLPADIPAAGLVILGLAAVGSFGGFQVGSGLAQTGILQIFADNPSAPPPVFAVEGGYSDLPGGVASAASGVLTTTLTPDPIAGYTSAPVDVNSLPSTPPPTPGPTPGPTPLPPPPPPGPPPPPADDDDDDDDDDDGD